jgi:hypothetical protein
MKIEDNISYSEIYKMTENIEYFADFKEFLRYLHVYITHNKDKMESVTVGDYFESVNAYINDNKIQKVEGNTLKFIAQILLNSLFYE